MRAAKITTIFILLLLATLYLFAIRIYGIDEVSFGITHRFETIQLSLLDRFPILQPKQITSQKVLVSENRIGLGIYNPANDPKTFRSVTSFENTVDRKMKYNLMFRSWGDEKEVDFPSEYVKGWKALNITPIISWEPWKRNLDLNDRKNPQPKYSLEKIAKGDFDGYIRQWAIQAKISELPIILRFAHEQSIPVGRIFVYPWQGDPVNYKLAFKRIVTIFREVGADNVEFMWNPLAYWPEELPLYYPGDNYVDYIGLSVLNQGVGTGANDNRWKTCSMLFDDQYNLVKDFKKKVIVAEFGSSEKGGNKSEWITDCLQRIEGKPNVIGLVLLEVTSDSHYKDVNWIIESTKKSLDTFKYQISVRNFK